MFQHSAILFVVGPLFYILCCCVLKAAAKDSDDDKKRQAAAATNLAEGNKRQHTVTFSESDKYEY